MGKLTISFTGSAEEVLRKVARHGECPYLDIKDGCNIPELGTCPLAIYDNSNMSCSEIAKHLLKLHSRDLEDTCI